MEVLELSKYISSLRKEELKKLPFHLNVIEASARGNLKETGHSRVLAQMLRYPAVQKSFLKHFIKKDLGELRVARELRNVDVALYNSNYFVIIENKVNGAVEQPSQTYRYVHNVAVNEYHKSVDEGQVWLIYLNSDSTQPPSPTSTCDEEGNGNVMELLKDHFIVKSYMYDVCDWLRHLMENPIPGQRHIMSALDQYLDYLEWKFQTTKELEPMKENMSKNIMKELSLSEETSFDDRFAAFRKAKREAQDLVVSLDDAIKINSHSLMRCWEEQLKQNCSFQTAMCRDQHSFGIKMANNVWCGVWDGYDYPEHDFQPYWGFHCDSVSEKAKTMVPEILKEAEKRTHLAVFSNPETDEKRGWIVRQSTLKGKERILALWTAAKDLGYL